MDGRCTNETVTEICTYYSLCDDFDEFDISRSDADAIPLNVSFK